MTNLMKRSCVTIMMLAALVALQREASAQAKVEMTKAVAVPTADNENHWQVFVGFDDKFDLPTNLTDVENPDRTPIKNPKNFHLIDVDTGQRLAVIYIYFDTGMLYLNGQLKPNYTHPGAVTVYVDPSTRLDPKHHYHLYVLNVRFSGQSTKDPQPQRYVEFPKSMSSANAAPTSVPEPERGDPATRDSLSFTAADGREDANIYLSGEYSGASGEKFSGSVDVKIDIPFRKIIKNRTHTFGPVFELRASNNPKADPDSMNFGFSWEWPVWRYRGDNLQAPIRRIVWRNVPKIESERDFGNTNFIWESRFRFMSRTYAAKYLTFYFRPFVGQELGANINSPLKEAEGKFLYRPIAGTTLNLVFPVQAAGLEDISIEGSYIRRWPLRREVSFEEDDDKKLNLVSIGTSPRDYVTAKVNFDFTKAFGATVSYEYGQLPPTFKLVDHKTTIGLTYKIKVDR